MRKKNPAWLARCLCFHVFLSFSRFVRVLLGFTMMREKKWPHCVARSIEVPWIRDRALVIVQNSQPTCRKWSTCERQWTLQGCNHAIADDHNYSTVNNGITELLWRKCIRESFGSRDNTLLANSMTRSAHSGLASRHDRYRGTSPRDRRSHNVPTGFS